MANRLYEFGREGFLSGSIDVLTDTINVALVDTNDYTAAFDTDQFLSDIPVAAIVASGTLASKTALNGIFDAADLTLSAVSGDVSEALVIVQQQVADNTSILIGYIDSATNLPVTPNGGDIILQWDSALSGSAPGIFKL